VSWDKTGYGAPETQHAPVVHSMSHNMFNGVLNVFIYGDDGYIHHIWQTTCDKVPNPWGWCTWSVWYKISDKIPDSVPSNNPLSIGANIHLGIEVFILKMPVSIAEVFNEGINLLLNKGSIVSDNVKQKAKKIKNKV